MNYKILQEMIKDASHQSSLYVPGNYWKFYEKNILKQIKNNDLKKFRSWEGGAGTGNIQSFEGGAENLDRHYGFYFHPFDKKFNIIDNNFFIKKYNLFINKISKYVSFMSFFSLRGPLAKRYYFERISQYQQTLYDLIYSLDKDLLEISDSKFGDPNGFYKKNNFYSTFFLYNLRQINIIKKNTDFSNIKSVIELGSGIGMLASCFLKLKKNLKYIIIDIPPALFISEYYLRNLGFKVFGYEDLKKNSNISLKSIFESYQVICLPSWRLDVLKDYKSDLFINMTSFQEMEKSQSLNYLEIIKKNINSYFFLSNAVKGHFKTTKKNSFGVLEPTSMEDCEKALSDNFSIKYKEINDGTYKTIFEKKIISGS